MTSNSSEILKINLLLNDVRYYLKKQAKGINGTLSNRRWNPNTKDRVWLNIQGRLKNLNEAIHHIDETLEALYDYLNDK